MGRTLGTRPPGEAAVELPDAPQAVSIARDTRPASRALHFFFHNEISSPLWYPISKQRPPEGLRLKERVQANDLAQKLFDPFVFGVG